MSLSPFHRPGRLSSLVAALLLWLLHASSHADAPVGWDFQPFDTARAAAEREQKPLFVYFGRHGCPTCARVNHESLSDPTVRERYHANYVLAYVDTESGERLHLPAGERTTEMDLGIRYEVYGTPFFFFMEPDGSNITRIPGYVSAAQFLGLDAWVHGGYYRTMSLQEFATGGS